MPQIELKNVSYSYILKDGNKIKALDDLSVTFESNKINVIVGESGSGKTTLLRSICSLLDVDGDIYFDNINVDEINIKDRGISYITQENDLLTKRNVFDNIAMPLMFKKEKPIEIRRKVYEISEEFDLMHLLVRKVKELSKGQLKKVSFAKAILKDSDIYLFDEVFAGVDTQTSASLIEMIKTKMKKSNKTSIFVTHSIKDAFTLGDVIYVLKDGKCIDKGTPNEILKSNVSETRLLLHAEGF